MPLDIFYRFQVIRGINKYRFKGNSGYICWSIPSFDSKFLHLVRRLKYLIIVDLNHSKSTIHPILHLFIRKKPRNNFPWRNHPCNACEYSCILISPHRSIKECKQACKQLKKKRQKTGLLESFNSRSWSKSRCCNAKYKKITNKTEN